MNSRFKFEIQHFIAVNVFLHHLEVIFQAASVHPQTNAAAAAAAAAKLMQSINVPRCQ